MPNEARLAEFKRCFGRGESLLMHAAEAVYSCLLFYMKADFIRKGIKSQRVIRTELCRNIPEGYSIR